MPDESAEIVRCGWKRHLKKVIRKELGMPKTKLLTMAQLDDLFAKRLITGSQYRASVGVLQETQKANESYYRTSTTISDGVRTVISYAKKEEVPVLKSTDEYLALGAKMLSYLQKLTKDAGLFIPEWLDLKQLFATWLTAPAEGHRRLYRYEHEEYAVVDEFLDDQWQDILQKIKDGPPPATDPLVTVTLDTSGWGGISRNNDNRPAWVPNGN